MPEENKITKEDPKVDIDTSGPEFDVTLPEEKKDDVIEKEETVKEVIKDQEPEAIKEEPKEEVKEIKEEDTKLEDYSKGVQSRISKLTRKMREAERQRDSATEYAQALETQRQSDQKHFLKIDTDYWKRFETNIKTGMDSAQRELASAIEAGDAKAQVEANKRIATLAFDNANWSKPKNVKKMSNYLTVVNYQHEHHNIYLNNLRILKRKHGLLKIHGSEKIEL